MQPPQTSVSYPVSQTDPDSWGFFDVTIFIVAGRAA